MNVQPLAIYFGDELNQYGYIEKPWFQPGRLDAFITELRARALDEQVTLVRAPAGADEDILLFHSPAHLERVRRLCAADEGSLDHGPTFARQSVERAATHVVGAVMHATRRILSGEIKRAFVPLAGFHHAHAEQARNYCLYNDPAIAISHVLREVRGTVAYIDIDVHFGDGVYKAFESVPRVAFVDMHEDGSTLFPHSPEEPGDGEFPGNAAWMGMGDAKGMKLNLPLQAGDRDAAFLAAWEKAESFVRGHRPAFIVFESGVDCLAGDPLANLNVTPDAIRHITERVCAIADEFAEGRLLVLGGGGYDLDNMRNGWCQVVEGLLRRAPEWG